MTDKELIQAAQSGNRDATAELLLANRCVVAAVVMRLIHRNDRAKDVIQNVLAKAVQGLASFRNGCAFSTWLYRIAVNETTEDNRRAARQRSCPPLN